MPIVMSYMFATTLALLHSRIFYGAELHVHVSEGGDFMRANVSKFMAVTVL